MSDALGPTLSPDELPAGALVAQAPALMWTSDAEGAVTYVNDAWLAFTGRPLDAELGGGWAESIHPDDVDAGLAVFRVGLETRQPFEVEYRLRRADGAYRWIRDLAAPLRDADGAFTGFVGVCVEVHERRLAEERQRLSGDVLRAVEREQGTTARARAAAQVLVPRLADWCHVVLVGDDGVVREVATAHADPRRVAWYARARGEVPLDPVHRGGVGTVLRTGQPVHYPDFAAALDGYATDAAHRELLDAYGARSVALVPLHVRGRTIGVLGLTCDGDRRFSREDLAYLEELGRSVALGLDNAHLLEAARRQAREADSARALLDVQLEHAPVGYALLDLDLRYLRVNRALARLNGTTPAAHVGRRLPDLVPGVDPSVMERLAAVRDTGEPAVGVELRATAPHDPGTPRTFLLSMYPVRPRDGDLEGIAVLVSDITDRTASAQHVEEQRDLYETLLAAQADLGEAFLLLDGERILYVNAAATELAGRSAAELVALPSVLDVIPDADRPEAAERLRRVVQDRRSEPRFQSAVLRPGGERVDLELAAQPVGDRRQVVVIARDVTERLQAARERERLLQNERRTRQELQIAHRRASFLADAGALLERTLDLGGSLPALARLVVERRVADACSVELLTEDGRLRRGAGAARGSDARAAMDAGAGGEPLELDADHPVAEAARTRRRVVIAPLDDEQRRRMARDEEHLELLRRVPSNVGVCHPLTAGGRVVGVLSLGWFPGDEPALVGPESRLVEDLAGRLALAVQNAVGFAERGHVAHTLQQALLPPTLEPVPGLEVASRYVPGAATMDVGGDFYDLFLSAPGTWNVVVGDVCGKGAEAAAVTALARYTLRALADGRRTDPADLLGALNAALLRQRDDLRFVTAVLGRVREREDGFRVDVACAGHPPPLVVRAGGEHEAVDCAGPLLGIRPSPLYGTTTVDLHPGDALVLHTDGLTEARLRRPLTTGELIATAAAALDDGAEAVADALDALAVRERGARAADDLAMLVLRVAGPGS